MRLVVECVFMILAILLFFAGDYEMSILACIYARLIGIEDKVEKRQ